MKQLLFITAFLMMNTIILAQNETEIETEAENVKFVVGVEGGFIFQRPQTSIGDNWNYTYGVNVEYPIDKFSVGIGLLHTNYGTNDYDDFTGNSFIDDRGKERFYFYAKEFSLNYIVLSNRFKYRLPCNCVFLYAAYDLEFLGWISESKADQLYNTTNQPYDFKETTNLKKLNTSLGFGIGFKLHINDMLRIIMRPTYHITQRPSKGVNQFYKHVYRYLKINFGLQLGIE